MPSLSELTLKTLERGYLMSLATIDEQGVWVADVIYTYDEDMTIYWMSRTTRRHSLAIDNGSQNVAATITVTQEPGQADEGLQISGVASRIDNPSLTLLKGWMKKKKKPYISAMGAVLTDHVWYQLIPDRLELINEEHFGYDRQTVL